jgi:hypothetical protein
VRIAHIGHACSVFSHEVLERSRAAKSVLGSVSIREEDQRNAAGSQDSVELSDESDGLREVLQHVARDDEVLAGVRDRGKAVGIEVGDDVRFHVPGGCLEFAGGTTSQFLSQLATLVQLPAVHEANVHPGRQEAKRVLAGPDLDA